MSADRQAIAENQEIRLNSAWLEILVLALFNVSPLNYSSIGVQHSTLFSVRISPARRGGYLVFQISFLPYPFRFHFSLLVQDFAVIGRREEDKIS